jgi:TPP-dependent indolepyruvate ferredoxin oxidoreductase alpha subunit
MENNEATKEIEVKEETVKVQEPQIREIEIDTGTISFNLRDKTTQELYGTISFNPTDFNILKRFEEARKNILEAQKEFHDNDVELKNDGTPVDAGSEIIQTVEKLNDLICDQIDYVFDAKISKTIFGNKSPLALIKGNLFFENFMNAVQPIIEKEINKQMAETEKKTSKYTSKYNKKR